MLEQYIVLDLETTGLAKTKDKITEIAAVKVKNNKIIDKFQTLVNPGRMIPAEAVQLTGITNKMVQKEKLIQEILPKLVNFLEDYPIVAHNAEFDHGFLDYNSNKYLKQPITNKKICTVKLARKLFPKIVSCRLNSLCNYFNIDNKQAHRAMSDTLATTKLFLKFQAIMHNNGIQGENQIFDFFENPAAKLNLCTSSFI